MFHVKHSRLLKPPGCLTADRSEQRALGRHAGPTWIALRRRAVLPEDLIAVGRDRTDRRDRDETQDVQPGGWPALTGGGVGWFGYDHHTPYTEKRGGTLGRRRRGPERSRCHDLDHLPEIGSPPQLLGSAPYHFRPRAGRPTLHHLDEEFRTPLAGIHEYDSSVWPAGRQNQSRHPSTSAQIDDTDRWSTQLRLDDLDEAQGVIDLVSDGHAPEETHFERSPECRLELGVDLAAAAIQPSRRRATFFAHRPLPLPWAPVRRRGAAPRVCIRPDTTVAPEANPVPRLTLPRSAVDRIKLGRSPRNGSARPRRSGSPHHRSR